MKNKSDRKKSVLCFWDEKLLQDDRYRHIGDVGCKDNAALHARELFGDNRGQNRKQSEAYAEGHIYVKRVEFDGKSAARNHCTNRQD